MVAAMPGHVPDPQVVPCLLYADAGPVIDWLIRTFGLLFGLAPARWAVYH